MSVNAKLTKLVDHNAQEDEGRKKGRTHLGASVLGKKCLRAIWYGWRWAHVTKHQGRLLRLFSRGHREEGDLARRLRRAGFDIQTHAERLCYHEGSDSYVSYPWELEFPAAVEDVSDYEDHIARAEARGQGPKQFTFSDHEGHFGGSSDARIVAAPEGLDLPTDLGPGLGEYKTHGEKSFIDLAGKLEDWRKHVTDPAKNRFTGKGVLSSKIEHYVQMQIYMRYFGLKWGLYVAVCKNTDDLYFEVVYYKEELAEAYADRAAAIIKVRTPPARLSNDPSWWECKFCDFREICHRGQAMQKNCRSCAFASPIENKQWLCGLYRQELPPDFMPGGCDHWEQLPQ